MKKNSTLTELLVGIFFIGVLIQIACLIFWKDCLYNSIGAWSGIIICLFSAISMKNSIEESLDYGETGAAKHMWIGYLTRMLVTLVVAGIVIYFKLGNYITLLVGLFSLKLAAYMQPFVHKIFLRFRKSEDFHE